ncbi:helix-turn-helix transcriptional regulator [Bradyrhizobium barranii]|uniref:Helix-turn-helix transcriptional regulator n=1 Tax=Bradyrhizobium barranii TaxID=2992140 RepID=A0ABY3QWV3_9BRAD|nr:MULTISPECIES: winged helix-turn-helix domain-containing protein [Bradyrhizobium]UFW90086.1 helix-turn-helix transcriptional regulator [Bradyrhizobium japonicum]CUU19649.1 Signal transduction response regulator Disease resistance protein Tetratricopeptide repeatcontaining protein CDS [Bradyrhizobium sp.]
MSVQPIGSSCAIRFRFGPFELNVSERSLSKAGQILPLGGRAYDILIALLENAGEVVPKSELIARVWPDVTVEEGSLRVHLSALRKTLGDGQFGDKYIANIQGRGYRFIAPVTPLPAALDSGNASSGLSSLPPALGRMVGRSKVVLEIQRLLQTDQRLTTILGAGGIGKTTVALSVGHAALADFSGAVFFVDLSTVTDNEQVIGAVASAVGLVPQPADPKEALLNFLSARKALIVLDSCEHLIERSAEIVDYIVRNTPAVYILATSRETLRVPGERVFRLCPLDCPPEQPQPTASEVLAYPAARLFAERVSARRGSFSLSDDEAPMVAEICRKLDGIALAIELAAGRAAVFGVGNTVARLGSRIDLLKFGRRTANPRHQTLKATLDWSHDHLSEAERIVLRRVAIFIGPFSLEAACTVAEQEGTDRSEIEGTIANLVNKSLIVAWPSYRQMLYRLLDTTRSYALEKLAASGEHNSMAARHAIHLSRSLEDSRDNLFDLESGRPPGSAIQHYLGDVRAALEWSFGPRGNGSAAIRLAAAASRLFLAKSLFVECRDWMEKAINRIAADCDPRDQMEVHASLALSLMFTAGNSERVRDAFNTALAFAERHDDAYQQLRLLSGLSMYLHRTIDAAGSLEVARRAESIANKTGNPEDAALADSMLGAAYYILADHVRAPKYLERALHRSPASRRFNATQYLFDLRTTSLFNLTRSHWFAGNLDRAADYAERTIEEAERSDHPVALCRALMLTMPFYFWIDDLGQVEPNLSALELTAEKYSLEPFRAVATGLRGRYLVRVGQTEDGMRHLRDGLEKLRILRYEMLVTDFVSELALGLAKQNERAEALALIDGSIATQLGSNRPLHLPALLLAKGAAFVCREPQQLGLAAECFGEAMTLAGQQSALSFELRAGLELARIWIDRGQTRKAHDLIEAIYGRFTEGFETPDLMSARLVLERTRVRARQAG